MILIACLNADLLMQLREVNGRTVFERNSAYDVVLQCMPTQPTVIGAIGEVYIEYDARVFIPVTSFAQDYYVLPSPIFESEKISFNNVFASDLNHRCIQYAKTDNNGPFLTMVSLQNLYRLHLRVKPNAPTGNTQIRFIYTADNNRTKMIDSLGNTIPLIVRDLTVVIDLDKTRPTTSIAPAPGIYNYIPQVRLQSNEDSTVHYRVVGGSNIWLTTVVSENQQTAVIPLPGVAGQVRYSTVQYYSEDFALDKAHNLEVEKSAAYIVDQEPPLITNVVVPTQTVALGTYARVQFDAFDALGVGNESVMIGGKTAQYVSGAGNGTYVFRRLIDGTEQLSGQVVIAVTDVAANSSTNTGNAISLDFGGPYFYDIVFDPPTPQVNQELRVHFTSSETLRELPKVLVGKQYGFYISNQVLRYTYGFTVTGNGWYVDLAFLADTLPPYIERVMPGRDSTGVPVNTSIYFRVGDNENLVNTQDMVVKINNVTAYQSGMFVNGYTGRITWIDDAYDVTCVPPSDFANNATIPVAITVADVHGNTTNELYVFSTGVTDDMSNPFIDNEYPRPGTVTASVMTQVSFLLHDLPGAGPAPDRLSLYMTEYIPVRKPQGIEYKEELRTVMVNGQFTEEFTGVVYPDAQGNLFVNVQPQEPFHPGVTVSCTAVYRDLTRQENAAQSTWQFIVLSTHEAGGLNMGTVPLAYPTIYDPDNDQHMFQQLTFSLQDPADITLRMYDLSGDMVWTYSRRCTAGYQVVDWDGRDARGKMVGNGPYIWYIINNDTKKVIGRGTSIIMR
jgi:hypothetical protein